MPPPQSEQSEWFARHLQPHEAMLRAWLSSQFRVAGELDDIVQESFLRVLRARETVAIESPKAFLFATARNLALGLVRRNQVHGSGVLAETGSQDVLDEGVDVANAVAHAQELQLLTQAIQSLPTRCRQIITLRKIYGLSQREVAAQLGISEHTVEAQGTIGLRKITEFFSRLERPGHRHE